MPKLILINHYASIPRWPGPTRNFDFAAALAKKGWRVTLLSCRFNHYLRRYLPSPPRQENGVGLAWIWSTPYQGNSMMRELNILTFSLISFFRGLFTPGDVVLTVTPPLESAFAAWLLARVKGVPFVLDVEDLWPDSIIAMGFRNKWVIGWLRFLERFLYRHSDRIFAVAAEMKEYLIKFEVPADKIDLIPLGANAPLFHQSRQETRAQYGWKDDQIVAVYVGAHGPANALETMIRAAANLGEDSRIQLVLFGDGSDKPRLKGLAGELGLHNLKLENPVPPERVPDILRAADIGVASLKNTETFKTVRPNKLYEYMAVGLPIICCIDGEAKRLIQETGSGTTVTPEDDLGLAEALKRLASNPALRRELSANGQAFFEKQGNRENLAHDMDQGLKKVMAETRVQGRKSKANN